MSRRFPSLLVALLAVLAVVAAACSSSAETTETSASSTAPPTSAESSTSAPAATAPPAGKPDVVVPAGPTPTELYVEDLIEGEGPEAQAGDYLVMHYVGVRHADGGQFDASWDRGEPFSVLLGAGRVIQGWDQGIVGMKPGGRRLLSIPADLAYGDQARGADIPANSALVFVVDLLELLTPPTVENAPAPVTELEVTVLAAGDGEEIRAGSVVEMHYVAVAQPTGEVFASSFASGQPVIFEVAAEPSQVIPAWNEGLVGLRVGDHARLVIPPALGLGGGGGDVVGPDDTIITEVQIVRVLSTAG